MFFLDGLLNGLIKSCSSNLKEAALHNSAKTDQTDLCSICADIDDQPSCGIHHIKTRAERIRNWFFHKTDLLGL